MRAATLDMFKPGRIDYRVKTGFGFGETKPALRTRSIMIDRGWKIAWAMCIADLVTDVCTRCSKELMWTAASHKIPLSLLLYSRKTSQPVLCTELEEPKR